MNNTKITSEVRLVSDVLYSGCFEVPRHQRYYDWKVEQVEDFLHDIRNALDAGKPCYFIGSIMLLQATPTHQGAKRINDGQQRLITLSLLIAALCRRFAGRPRDNGRETLALRALFIRPDNQVSKLIETSGYTGRITPPRSDCSKYKQIIGGRDIGTNGALTEAWNKIDDFVGPMNKKTREKFFDFIMQKVEISVLYVPEDVGAHSVFEALNARGKPLHDVDLIRNYLYSFFSENDNAERPTTVHENLERTAVVLRHQNRVHDYFRCYLQCRYGHLQQKRLYREARLEIEQATINQRDPSNQVFDLIADLGRKENIELFRTICSAKPNEGLAGSLPKTAGKRGLETLLIELKGYKVSHPLVFALLYRFISESDPDYKKKIGRVVIRSLKNLTSFVMRTAFIAPKFEPSRFDKEFSDSARDVFVGNDLDSLDIFEVLKNNDEWNVCNKTNFIKKMTEVEFRNDRDKKPMSYLFGINAQEQKGSDALRMQGCSVEHILPKSDQHSSLWSAFQKTNVEQWVYRTGNLVVISKRENQPGATFNQSYNEKKRLFEQSAVQMARDIAAKYQDWTPQVISERSEMLAKVAANVWSFSRPAKS